MPKTMPVKQPMLISKMQNISISAFESVVDKSSSICIPKNARTFDLVKVINKCGNPVDIITFRKKGSDNSIGMIVRRYFVEQLPLSKRVTQKDYKYKPTESYSKNEIMNRQVKTKIVQGEAEPEYENETQVIMRDGDKYHLYIKKIKTSKYLQSFDRETQSLYHYQKGEKRKGYEIGPYIRAQNSYMSDLFPFSYHFENFSEESKEQLMHDRYFPLHLYSFEGFKKIAPSVASHPEHTIQYQSAVVWKKNLPAEEQSIMVPSVYGNRITINFSNTLNDNRITLINSAAQAQELAYMHTLSCDKLYDFYDKKCVQKPITLLGEYYKTLSTIQKREQAKNAGDLAVEEYKKSIIYLKKEFSNLPDNLINEK